MDNNRRLVVAGGFNNGSGAQALAGIKRLFRGAFKRCTGELSYISQLS